MLSSHPCPRHEDVIARFVPTESKAWKLEEQLAAARGPKLVVRKTFLEMQVPWVAIAGRIWEKWPNFWGDNVEDRVEEH